MRRMVERVVVRDADGRIVVLNPGGTVPDWAEAVVGEHATKPVPTRKRATTRKTTPRKTTRKKPASAKGDKQ